jgi:hypothetical protein
MPKNRTKLRPDPAHEYQTILWVDPFIDKESCDFVYIDGNHSYSHVKEDLRLWFPKVKRGGVFAGHDYFDAVADKDLEPIFCDGVTPAKLTSYGAKSAVDEFAAKSGLELFLTREKLTRTQFPTWYFIKR